MWILMLSAGGSDIPYWVTLCICAGILGAALVSWLVNRSRNAPPPAASGSRDDAPWEQLTLDLERKPPVRSTHSGESSRRAA